MKVCDNCKRDPEPIETDQPGKLAWWFVIPKDHDGPVVLMSNLELNWIMCLERNPIGQNDEDTFICTKCFYAMMEDED